MHFEVGSEMIGSTTRLGRRSPEFRAKVQRGVTGPNADILTVEGVAKLLHCTVDKVRRIPKSALAARCGPGKHVLYLRSEVMDYVRLLPLCDDKTLPDTVVDCGGASLDDFLSVRIRSLNGATQ